MFHLLSCNWFVCVPSVHYLQESSEDTTFQPSSAMADHAGLLQCCLHCVLRCKVNTLYVTCTCMHLSSVDRLMMQHALCALYALSVCLNTLCACMLHVPSGNLPLTHEVQDLMHLGVAVYHTDALCKQGMHEVCSCQRFVVF